MKIKTRAAAAVLAAAVTAASMGQLGAAAAEWINLSAWAYPDVSAFVSAGLLPDNFSGIGDYTRTVTKGELCSLIWSVLDATGMTTSNKVDRDKGMTDSAYAVKRSVSSSMLSFLHLDHKDFSIEADEPVTREWAAALTAGALARIGVYDCDPDPDGAYIEEARKLVSDLDELDGYVQHFTALLICDGIMSGTGSGRFEPQAEMTVEQAIVLAGRINAMLPRIIISDSEIGAGEKALGNGLTEIISPDKYTVADCGVTLMEFETDVYSVLSSCSYGGRRLILAVNFNDKTDVFDADTKELLYTIPYIVNDVDQEKGYAYTVSNRYMPSYTGIYSLDNKELLAPEYSRAEADMIAANNFTVPKVEKTPSSGWIYYADWNDKGHIYRMDTNGENKQLIEGKHDCWHIIYINDRLYYKTENKALYTIGAEGGEETLISDKNAWMLELTSDSFYNYIDKDAWNCEIINGHKVTDRSNGAAISYMSYIEFKDGGVLYYERDEEAIKYTQEYNDGDTLDLATDGDILYKYVPGKGSVKIADFYAGHIMTANNGDIYFLNEQQLRDEGESPIYMYDGSELKIISGDYKAETFAFMCDFDKTDYWRNSKIDTGRIGFVRGSDTDSGTYHVIDLATGEITEEKMLPESESPRNSERCDDYSKEFGMEGETILYNRHAHKLTVTAGGRTAELENMVPVKRMGDILYCLKYEINNPKTIAIVSGLSYIRPNAYTLVSYRISTGEVQELDSEFSSKLSNADNVFVYSTNTGKLRAADSSGNVREVYPNKGIGIGGAFAEVVHMPDALWQNRSLYRIDTEGNISRLTYTDSEYKMYVPNGAKYARASFNR